MSETKGIHPKMYIGSLPMHFGGVIWFWWMWTLAYLRVDFCYVVGEKRGIFGYLGIRNFVGDRLR